MLNLKLELLCYNHEEKGEVVSYKMVSVHGQGDNLHQSGMFQCPKCKAKIYGQADGCIAHLIAIDKGNASSNFNHEIGKKGIPIKVVECECPNCKMESKN